MTTRIYLELVCLIINNFCFSQKQEYSIEVIETPFRFEVLKKVKLFLKLHMATTSLFALLYLLI